MDNHTILIVRHLEGILTQEEQALFDHLMETEAAFRTEVAIYQKAHKILELDALQMLKENARKLDKEHTVAPKNHLKIWKIAASILLIAVCSLLFYAQRNYNDASIYAQAYTPAGDHISDLGAEKSATEAALEYYNQKEFKQAITAFTSVLFRDKENQEALFYLGQSYYQNEELDQAIIHLERVTGAYQSEAQWYVALAQLKKNDAKACLVSLDKIIRSNQDLTFVKKAQKLKAKINSPLRKLVF